MQVPEGWKLVPINPTGAMVDAGVKHENWSSYKVVRDIYQSMLSAAPISPHPSPDKFDQQIAP
jgi:hypothetical protein